jgi:hypothetical protein
MANSIPLKKVIGELLDSSDQSEHVFRKVYRIGIGACRKFNMDVYGSFKTVLLAVGSDYTVPFPDDYMDYSMIGVVNDAGEAVPLTHNPNLSTLKSQYVASLGQVVDVPTIGDTGSGNLTNLMNYWLNFGYNGYGYMHLYGLGGGTATIGEFVVDNNSRCFLLQTGYPYSTIMLEYLSDGYDCDDDDYMVDVRAVEALKWWIRWMRAVDDRKKYSLSDVSYFHQQYLNQMRDAKTRINKAHVSELQQVYRGSVKLAARA